MTHDDQLLVVLANARVIFFDFDGPVCDVFAGLPTSQVAKQLSALLASNDPVTAAKAYGTDDPIEVFRIAYEAGPELGQEVEQASTAAEVEAVAVSGPPTPGAVEALQTANSSGRAVAVVSNNSAECVEHFVKAHGLGAYIAKVIGRPTGRPHLRGTVPGCAQSLAV
ncbi:HAD family hydrolase [Kitasatospora albolonga]